MFKLIFAKLKTLKKGTVVRTILQILAYVNQLIALLGSTSFANNAVYQWIAFAITVIITAISYWYNNDWSKFAQVSGDIFDMLKDGRITPEELAAFTSKYEKKTDTVESIKAPSEDTTKKD